MKQDDIVFIKDNVTPTPGDKAVTVLTDGVRNRNGSAAITVTARLATPPTGTGTVALAVRFYDGDDPGAKVVQTVNIGSFSSATPANVAVVSGARSGTDTVNGSESCSMTPWFDVVLVVTGTVTACTFDRITAILRNS